MRPGLPRPRRRHGFTLVELVVGLLVASLFVMVASEALSALHKGDDSTERAAAQALAQSILMEQLLRDLRSSSAVEPDGAGWRIRLHVLEGGALVEREVTWSQELPPPAAAGAPRAPVRVTRRDPAGRTRVFEVLAGVEGETSPLALRIEPVDDVLFIP